MRELPAPLFPVVVVCLNAIPLFGALFWGWAAFDLIFLYWFENLVIGAFMVVRMLALPYSHPLELVAPLFLALFFTFHYGMFCAIHGSFVFSLFSNSAYDTSGIFGALEQVPHVMENRALWWGAAAMVGLQFADWVRDSIERGFGNTGIKELMTAPYRRIIILHFVLLLSGFALGVLDEPMMGLVVLVVVKTAFDVHNWRLDGARSAEEEPFVITPEVMQEIEEKFSEPVVEVDGKEIRYKSFAAFKRSWHFGLLVAVLRGFGRHGELKAMRRFVDSKIAAEKQLARDDGDLAD